MYEYLDTAFDELMDANARVASPEPVVTALEFEGKVWKLRSFEDMAKLQARLRYIENITWNIQK